MANPFSLDGGARRLDSLKLLGPGCPQKGFARDSILHIVFTMRISGGAARGVTLKISKSSVHRPAMDKVRQGVFSSLGTLVDEAAVCDLFAGTGSYGLEALSRGASRADFVEKDRRACQMIRDNVAIVAKSMRLDRLHAKVHAADALKWSPSPDHTYDLVFCDPPYDLIEEVSEKLFAQFDHLLNPRGTVVFEMPGELSLDSPNWNLRKRLGKGRNQPTVCFYERP